MRNTVENYVRKIRLCVLVVPTRNMKYELIFHATLTVTPRNTEYVRVRYYFVFRTTLTASLKSRSDGANGFSDLRAHP